MLSLLLDQTIGGTMNFVQIILSAAKSVKISGAILVAICSHETRLQNIMIQDNGSPTYGICQVKLATASMLGYQGSPEGLMDPETNAHYAALYLKFQHDRYKNWCKAIAAYNAGRFNESQIIPGHPRNLKYLRRVQSLLEYKIRKTTSCDIVSMRDNNVTENNGAGR